MHRDKCNRALNNAEEQLHHLEKVKIENHSNLLKEVLRDSCFNSLREITEKLEDWYKIAQVSIVQSDCLSEEFSLFLNDCNLLQKQLIRVREEQKTILDLILRKLILMKTNQKDLNLKDYFKSKTSLESIDNLIKQKNDQLNTDTVNQLTKNIMKE